MILDYDYDFASEEGYNRAINCVLYVNGIAQGAPGEMASLTFTIIDTTGREIAAANEYVTLGTKTTNGKFHITLVDNSTTTQWLTSGYYLRVVARLSDGTSGYILLSITW